tara:strand:- start:856 stop:1308 length:453 start_codon:yes stop_codon:yes gene_type:complete
MYIIFNPCSVSYRVKSGKMYRSRDKKTAEIIDILRNISIHLSYNINEEDGELLRENLQNTSFKELLYNNPNILGWNYDKGREIGIKIYNSSNKIYPPEEILSTLFHELAHSLTIKNGHHEKWKEKNNYLQSFVPFYVNIFVLKTKEIDNE